MPVPSLRDQARIRNALLADRLDEIVPRVMEREGIAAWVVAGREYNEDPVLTTMLPATWLSARRRTILVFTDSGRTRRAVARYAVGDAFPPAWDPHEQPDQWAAVAAILAAADPGSIALDRSPAIALADGLSASEHDALVAALPEELRGRLVSSERLAVGWLETRLPAEVALLREACAIGHEVIALGLSADTVTPGTTTTEDLAWWFRERVRGLGLESWFHPTVSIQRRGTAPRRSFAAPPGPETITPGDLLHVDFGLVMAGMHTDQQQHGYVLRPGESEAPAGLRSALAIGNALQDLLVGEFGEGRSGNEVLAATREAAIDEGIRPRIYSHPLGLHGHAAGPSIGQWDQQEGVPGLGDLEIHGDTAWSIELGADVDLPEWGHQQVSIMLEEDAIFTGGSVEWLHGRQTRLHLIG